MIKSFGRKVRYNQVFTVLIVSLIIGFFISLISSQTLIGVLFGLLCFIITTLLFALNIQKNYDYWIMSLDGIQYYYFESFWKKVVCVLFPFMVEMKTISYVNINSIYIGINGGLIEPEGIGPDGVIASSFYIVGTALDELGQEYYLTLDLEDNESVDLYFPKYTNKKDMIEAVKYLSEQTGKKVCVKSQRQLDKRKIDK